MEQFLDKYGYLAIMIGTFLEGETAILVASSLTHTGLFALPGTIFFGFAGSFVSDWVYYTIGRVNGKYFIEKRPKLNTRIGPVRNFFKAHKIQILFTYRFLYGFRIILPITIGMSGIPPLQFLGFSMVTGLLWASTVSTVGYILGKFLSIRTEVFQENLLFIVLGFAIFGSLVGYGIKLLASKHMHVPQQE
jgi:membrane protein DedA with SNARE-associated domain